MKLLVPEQGTPEAMALWLSADRIVSSRLLYPEVRSAVARAGRSGRLNGVALARARTLVELLWADVHRLGLTDGLAQRAGEAAERHGLRGADAVHLASALEIADVQTVLVTADREILAAARICGVATAPLG